MEFLVNGKVFKDYDEALKHERKVQFDVYIQHVKDCSVMYEVTFSTGLKCFVLSICEDEAPRRKLFDAFKLDLLGDAYQLNMDTAEYTQSYVARELTREEMIDACDQFLRVFSHGKFRKGVSMFDVGDVRVFVINALFDAPAV